MSTATKPKGTTKLERTWLRYPVVELFGPTVQGEGPAVGERCWFLRLGGCDYRCSWCDTMYSVLPEQWKELARSMTAREIAKELSQLGFRRGSLLVISGGNPVIRDLSPLLDVLNARVHVETQGSLWKSWLTRCELVVFSPKPPSAMWGEEHNAYKKFTPVIKYVRHLHPERFALKLVAFDDADLDFAEVVYQRMCEAHGGSPTDQWYLSAGTAQEGDLVANVIQRFRWLTNAVLARPGLAAYRVGLQQHVLVWPGERNR